ncbi:hypothetical protein [Bacillus sp. B15-48]|uniref:hypothetical protein n=1 Tax=Bacillus sp. B15-48 TaxID=1548601 RepID=UPI00193EE08A|nr:hypothetical protein [Bacillus sp. B15-48]MBM4762787.1 hypothetical protein [Bacillus sp. B15-48]
MLIWIIIALSPFILLLVIEEMTQFFWKRYMNAPGGMKEGIRWGKASEFFLKIRTIIGQMKLVTIIKSKFFSLIRKYRKDPSH